MPGGDPDTTKIFLPAEYDIGIVWFRPDPTRAQKHRLIDRNRGEQELKLANGWEDTSLGVQPPANLIHNINATCFRRWAGKVPTMSAMLNVVFWNIRGIRSRDVEPFLTKFSSETQWDVVLVQEYWKERSSQNDIKLVIKSMPALWWKDRDA